MARLIFSKIKEKYTNYRQYKDWLNKNSYPLFCAYSWLIDQSSLTVDHYKPKEHYPKLKSHPDNLNLCTADCNSRKGDYHPSAKNRNVYKTDEHKIFNYRQEDIGKYVVINNDGNLSYKSASYKGRFNFNSKVFRLNEPRFREIRKEYLETLAELKTLHKIYTTLESERKVDDQYFNKVKKLFHTRQRACSRRYIFYKLLNINIPKHIEKLLIKKTIATFS